MTESEVTESSGTSRVATLEHRVQGVAVSSDLVMDLLELTTALIMVILFAIGVFDLGLKLFELVASGHFTQPNKIIKIIDTALLLMIIVEIYRTVIAYVEDLNILPIVLNVGLIAMARKVISFRTGKYGSPEEALITAGAYGLLLVILVGAFYLVHHVQEETKFNIYNEPTGGTER